MMEVTKVWWDGNKIMAEPVDPAAIYKDKEQGSTCNNALRLQGKAYPRTCAKCGFGSCVELAQQQKPMTLRWQQAPLQTAWGDEMVVASVAIDNDHTLSLYCERDQAPKVEAMFAQRSWVGLTDYERTLIRKEVGYNQFMTAGEYAELVQKATESMLKVKNQ